MNSIGTVHKWNDDAGWGVVESPDTPGGCWVHYSVLQVSGWRSLSVGDDVAFEWEVAEQDGYSFRATSAWLPESGPETPSNVKTPDEGTGI